MKIRFLILTSVFFTMYACHTGGSDRNVDETAGLYAAMSDSPNEILVSKEQFEMGGMKIGGAKKVTFNQLVHASAYVLPSPQAVFIVSSILPGKVSRIYVTEGDVVGVGQVLFTIRGKELIEIQEDYITAFLHLELLRSDFDRQQHLEENGIGATKDLKRVESEMKVAEARIESLKAQLAMLNIHTKELEEGKLVEEVKLVSGIKGQVSSMNISLGSVVGPDVELLRIIDPEGLRLEFNIFEKDLDLLKTGQLIHVNGQGNYLQETDAILAKIGVEIDKRNRSLTCIAELDPRSNRSFVVNQFLELDIVICEREVMAVPESALIEEDGRYYVLVLKKEEGGNVIFRKKQIEIGVIQQGRAEIKEEQDIGEILIEVGYHMPGDF